MKNTKDITGIRVPFFPAKLEYEAIKDDLHSALDLVGESGYLILGPKVSEFEKKIADITTSDYCIGCASGTDATGMALTSIGIKPGDEVILPANVYPTVFGVAAGGAKPVLIDVQKDTGSLDPKKLERAITKKTRVVVAVHLCGLPADIKTVKKICRKHNLYLIEDCAQALGASYEGKPVGSFGDLSVFSFYPTKNLGALGDAGAIVTNNRKIYEKLKMLRVYGEKNRYESQFISKHSRLDELQAAFLLIKIPYLKKWLITRKRLASIYIHELNQIKSLQLPLTPPNKDHSFHLFVIQTQRRDQLRRWLSNNGIETCIHYPKPIHFVKPFLYTGKIGSFPQSERWSRQSLSLPLHPFIPEDQIKFVAQMIKEFFIKK